METIPGFENYMITPEGDIYSLKTHKFLSPKTTNGYKCITLDRTTCLLHRLVALTYIPTSDTSLIVNHKDCNKMNNHVDNLEWITQRENCNRHDKDITHPRKVVQIDTNGRVLNVYPSVTTAATAMGLSRGAISKACLGKNKTAGGYRFKYEDDKHCHTDKRGEGKEIQGYPNYIIYDDGDIYSVKRRIYLKRIQNDAGYQYVTLSNHMGKANVYVHCLVASHFLHKKENCVVNHKDLNKANNHVSNLEWITSSENRIHAHINRSMVPKVV